MAKSLSKFINSANKRTWLCIVDLLEKSIDMLPKEVLTAKNKTQIMDQEVKKGQATV
jgi:hypothetical protein